MIAAFGVAYETGPAVIAIADVTGVHITRLRPDGSGRERGECDKTTIDSSTGSSIALAPLNDLLGLTIGEGIEKTLAVYEATGLATWAAGSAARFPALADAAPAYIDCVTLIIDDDTDGGRHAEHLGWAGSPHRGAQYGSESVEGGSVTRGPE